MYSLAHAPTAARVRDTFADVLAGDQGRSVQVYACVDVMTGVEAGFHPHLGPLIEEHLRALTRSRDTG